MQCDHCGAPLNLVTDQDYVHCDHCETYQFLTPDQEGVKTLDQTVGTACPQCGTELACAFLEQRTVLQCPNCRGLVMTMATFGAVVPIRRAQSQGQWVPQRPLRREEFQRQTDCPGCGRRMETHAYVGPGPVVIDSCSPCQLVWLDHGELTKIEHAPGAVR